jgi:predicted nicotinamide N-methyase
MASPSFPPSSTSAATPWSSAPDPRSLTALRRRAARLYPLRDLRLDIAGSDRPYTIALPANPDDPLDRFAAGPGAGVAAGARVRFQNAASAAREAVAAGMHMPYWGLLWTSGQALAEALLAEPAVARGAKALELGCGLGVTACAALEAGTTLWAADCFAEALLYCRYNTLRNTGRVPHTRLIDWRTEIGRATCQALGPFALLLAADVLYEQDDLAPLLDLVPRLLAPGGGFWLAEPGRRVARAFVEAARERGWAERESVYERAWAPDGDVVRVGVHRFTPTPRTD